MGYVDKLKNIASDAQTVINHLEKGSIDARDTLLKNPKVLAEKVLKENALSASITIPNQEWVNGDITYKTITVPFYIENDFSFSVSNDWKPLLDPNALFGQFLGMANFTNMNNGAPNITFQSEALSTKIWKGTTFESFNISCLFVCTNRNINPVEIVKLLGKTSFPKNIKQYAEDGGHGQSAVDFVQTTVSSLTGAIKEGVGKLSDEGVGGMFKKWVTEGATTFDQGVKSMGLVAPLNYGVRFDMDKEGNQTGEVIVLPGTTVRLDVGNWFSAGQLLVKSISNIQFSKEIVAPPVTGTIEKKGPNDLYDPSPANGDYGFPLYVKCQLTLEPAQMVTLEKFFSYFKKTQNDATVEVAQKVKSAASILPL